MATEREDAGGDGRRGADAGGDGRRGRGRGRPARRRERPWRRECGRGGTGARVGTARTVRAGMVERKRGREKGTSGPYVRGLGANIHGAELAAMSTSMAPTWLELGVSNDSAEIRI